MIKSYRIQVQELEKHVGAGDISGMATSIASLHENWESLSENEQHEVLKLEAIFLSLVQLRTEAAP